MSKKDPRNMIGYGSKDKKIKWPNNAKIACYWIGLAVV